MSSRRCESLMDKVSFPLMLSGTAGGECLVVMGLPISDSSSIFCTFPWGSKAQRFILPPLAPRLKAVFP